jgi:hypothetical protein
MERVMRKAAIDENMSAEDVRRCVRCINTCAVVAIILAAGLGAMAVASGHSGRAEAAASIESPEYTTAETRAKRSGVFLAYEIVY